RRAVARRVGLPCAGRPGARRRLADHDSRDEARLRRRLHARGEADARPLHERLGQPRRNRGPPLRDARARLEGNSHNVRILFVADVFGAPGRRAIETRLPALREELGADFCIVNGENAAAGRGITAKLADRLLASGADVVTLGNWTWGQRDFAPYLSGTDRVLRPANLSPHTPGRGLAVHDGVAVINLLGMFALNPFENAFITADRLVAEART